MKLLVATLLTLTLGGGQPGQTFAGIISDDMCAGDHRVMRMGPTDAECTHACVEEHDGSYVLVNEAQVYKLSDQGAAKAFAGKKTRVVGTLDAATGTITVKSIAAG